MKKIIVVSIFTLTSLFASAQIKVYPNGANVAIGATGPTGPTSKLGVTGDIDAVASGNAYRIQGNKILWYNSTATENIFVGVEAGNAISSGGKNSFLGYRAGYSNTSGSKNVAIGYEACSLNTYASENVAIGYQALGTQSFGSSAWSSYNTAVGYQALTANAPTITTVCRQAKLNQKWV